MGGKVMAQKVASDHKEISNHELQYKKRRQAKIVDLGGGRVKVLVWELPIRIWHWVTALAIVILLVTGFYIGRPVVSPGTDGSADPYLMGWMRLTHFVAGFVFMLGLIVRAYWTLFGNRYTTFDVYKKGYIRGFWETVKFYLFLRHKKPHWIGHNPMAQFAYWVLFGGCSLILSLTGMYLFVEPQPDTLLGKSFIWVGTLFGNSTIPRDLHLWAAWIIVVFIILHIYLAFREEYLERNGTMGSIFSGWKIDRKKYIVSEEDDK